MQIKDMFRKKIDREIQGVIFSGILQISLQHIKKVFREPHRKWVSGFPASLEVVNLIS